MPLNASHLQLAKFATKDDASGGYWRVVNRIQELVEGAPRVISERFISGN